MLFRAVLLVQVLRHAKLQKVFETFLLVNILGKHFHGFQLEIFKSEIKTSSGKEFYAFNVFETTEPLQCVIFCVCRKFTEIDSRAKSRFWEFGFLQ